MNGKKARMLRKQANGPQPETLYDTDARGTVTVNRKCTRGRYKDLKNLYRLVGV